MPDLRPLRFKLPAPSESKHVQKTRRGSVPIKRSGTVKFQITLKKVSSLFRDRRQVLISHKNQRGTNPFSSAIDSGAAPGHDDAFIFLVSLSHHAVLSDSARRVATRLSQRPHGAPEPRAGRACAFSGHMHWIHGALHGKWRWHRALTQEGYGQRRRAVPRGAHRTT